MYIHLVEPSPWKFANISHILRFKINILLDIGMLKAEGFFHNYHSIKFIGDTIKSRYLWGNWGEE